MICLVAKPFILILYGETYLPAVGPLRIVVWYTAFSYLGVARNAWMVCENRQKYLKYLYVSAAVLNVVLNLALIPSWGSIWSRCGLADHPGFDNDPASCADSSATSKYKTNAGCRTFARRAA